MGEWLSDAEKRFRSLSRIVSLTATWQKNQVKNFKIHSVKKLPNLAYFR